MDEADPMAAAWGRWCRFEWCTEHVRAQIAERLEKGPSRLIDAVTHDIPQISSRICEFREQNETARVYFFSKFGKVHFADESQKAKILAQIKAKI